MSKIELVPAKELAAVNKNMERMLMSTNPRMKEMMEWVLQARGKQLRPQLLLLCSHFGKKRENPEKVAAMLEIVHMASLVHDDIIDDAPLRRGSLSVQKKFGKNMAVYAGDYMIFCIVEEALKDDMYKKYTKLYSVFQQLCYGEIGQTESMFKPSVTEKEYVSNITGKTASLFETACELGGVAGGASLMTISKLGIYGANLGLLFQIRDDLLDYVSNEEEIGKPIFQDFYNGIYTLPVIYALSVPESKKRLMEIAAVIKETGLTKEITDELYAIIQKSNGFEKTRKKAEEYYKKAVNALKSLPDIEEKATLEMVLNQVYQGI